ncbi:MAG: response regulator transcription factor [Spirochaetales bacterium]|nr:response regulator transcription factor [Spirochaetales bacterium]
MAAKHILVVEDDEPIAELIRHNLARAGFRVTCLSSGEKLLLQAGREPPDLILLDLMLPGADGLEICRLLREGEATREVPIIMVTARGEEADIVRGLECGADDYVVKPFSPRVLRARVEAVMRRRARKQEGRIPGGEVIHFGQLTLDTVRHRVETAGRPVELTLTEFGILRHLLRQPGRVFSRAQIVEAVRGADYHVTDRAVDVAVFGLRKKLGASGRLVETVRGVGYRLREDGQAAGPGEARGDAGVAPRRKKARP